MRKSRLPWQKQRELMGFFVAGISARRAAPMAGVSHKTAAYYYHRIRILIAEQGEQESASVWPGEVEVDESLFGEHRKGRKGRSAAGQVPVFGIRKRGGKMHTKIIPDAKTAAPLPASERKVTPDSIVYSDGHRNCDVLDVMRCKHRRVNRSEECAEKSNHIGGLENFWRQTKRYLEIYNCIPRAHLHLYLKECEWRFNMPNRREQLTMIKRLVRRI